MVEILLLAIVAILLWWAPWRTQEEKREGLTLLAVIVSVVVGIVVVGSLANGFF